MPLGLSFAPTDQNQQEQQNKPVGTPIQDAIKILSLRIPSFAGAKGIAPDALLQGGGAGSFPFGGQTPGGLDEYLRRLFAGGGMAPTGGLPQPNVIPGGEARMAEPAPGPAQWTGGPVARMPDSGGGDLFRQPKMPSFGGVRPRIQQG